MWLSFSFSRSVFPVSNQIIWELDKNEPSWAGLSSDVRLVDHFYDFWIQNFQGTQFMLKLYKIVWKSGNIWHLPFVIICLFFVEKNFWYIFSIIIKIGTMHHLWQIFLQPTTFPKNPALCRGVPSFSLIYILLYLIFPS